MERKTRRTRRDGSRALAWGVLAWAAACGICAADATLSLEVDDGAGPVQAGDFIVVIVTLSDLGVAEAAGFQAFLGFNEARLEFVVGSYVPEPFGLPIITPLAAVDGRIDVASGVNPATGQAPTSEDSDLAILTFRSVAGGCVEQGDVFFRAHEPPTRFTDDAGVPIEPLILRVVLPEACPADLNGDCGVNVLDFFVFVDLFSAGDPHADLNNDGRIDVLDFFEFVLLFALGCP